MQYPQNENHTIAMAVSAALCMPSFEHSYGIIHVGLVALKQEATLILSGKRCYQNRYTFKQYYIKLTYC